MDSLLSSTNKRSQIVKSALDLFARKGYSGTTIKDISRAAGVTDGAMYRHFTGKEELARLIFEALMGDYSSELQKIIDKYPDLNRRIRETVHLTYSYYEKYPSAVSYALKSQHNFWEGLSESITHPHLLIYRIVEDGLAEGKIKKGDKLTLGGLFAGALMEPLTFHFYLAKDQGDIKKMAVEVTKRIKMMLGTDT